MGITKPIVGVIVNESDIFRSVVEAIESLSGDWDNDGDLTPDTGLIADLQMKSLDLVVLCTTLVREYGVMPMDELYAKLGEMPPETRELTLGGLVAFVRDHAPARASL